MDSRFREGMTASAGMTESVRMDSQARVRAKLEDFRARMPSRLEAGVQDYPCGLCDG